MPKSLRTLFFFLLLPHIILSQVMPKEGSSLHYRIIGFSFPPDKKINKYKVEIATGNYTTEEDFQKNIISRTDSKKDKAIVEVPSFGSQYTWRAVYTDVTGAATKSRLHHFRTTIARPVDTTQTRLRIIEPAAINYKDAFVFVDGNRVLYDMNGKPVWYLPDVEGMASERSVLRDMKSSPVGTITCMLDEKAYEIKYNGTVLWKGPDTGIVSGEKSEHYHHAFTRLANGHYMILGMETIPWNRKSPMPDDGLPGAHGSKVRQEGNGRKTTFGTVIEYDENGKVVWSWKSSKYFIGSDLEYYNPDKMPVVDVHENSFYFDENNKVIYVGFKNISRILKIKYPEGTVLAAYGEIYKPGVPEKGNGLFCDQHGCRLSHDGNLYLYNNNACNGDGALPTVIMMEEPHSDKDGLKKIWEYKCTNDDVHVNPNMGMIKEKQKLAQKNNMNLPVGKLFKLHPTSGGSVVELPDHSLFVCMNSEYCKIFIVTPGKKILWNAIPETFNMAEHQWYIIAQQYRASLITRAELERLIWNEETKK